MNTATLIAQAPAEILLGLALFILAAGAILVALSAEAGNYRDLGLALRRLRGTLGALRPRRRWTFNRAPAGRARNTTAFTRG